jgi:hypothetical protein
VVASLGRDKSGREPFQRGKPCRSKEQHLSQRVCDSHERRAIMLFGFKPLDVQHIGRSEGALSFSPSVVKLRVFPEPRGLELQCI